MDVLFAGEGWTARELGEDDLGALQAFFEANPAYFLAVNGIPPHPGEARQEFDDRPPPELPYGAVCVLGFRDEHGSLIGMASVLADFIVPQVWHIGLFIVATALHGRGMAPAIYGAMQDWMQAQGARWIRLGAVAAHPRAWRFWMKMGFTEVRRRHGLRYGQLTHDVLVMVKPLRDADIATYLAQVLRDRPES